MEKMTFYRNLIIFLVVVLGLALALAIFLPS
jgi:hypothetical protein